MRLPHTCRPQQLHTQRLNIYPNFDSLIVLCEGAREFDRAILGQRKCTPPCRDVNRIVDSCGGCKVGATRIESGWGLSLSQSEPAPPFAIFGRTGGPPVLAECETHAGE